VNDKKNKLRYRSIIKHFLNRLKKNFINSKHNLLTYKKYIDLSTLPLSELTDLESYYKDNNLKIIEGYSSESNEQDKFLKSYKDSFKSILEIGFNAGHSSEIFLSNNKNVELTSIDLGYWYYTKFGVRFLSRKFKKQINVIYKDSIQALSDFSTIEENTFFDLIYIDGNHEYEYAIADMLNCKKFANSKSLVMLDDVVISDDYRSLANSGPTRAWKELVNSGYVSEIKCYHFKDVNRGVAVGKYNFNKE
jgi:predicted O-methyltransferase YrrM